MSAYDLMNCRNLAYGLTGSMDVNPFDDSIYTTADNKILIINVGTYSIYSGTSITDYYSIIFNPFNYNTYVLSDNGNITVNCVSWTDFYKLIGKRPEDFR
jgi:hypothetical protein